MMSCFRGSVRSLIVFAVAVLLSGGTAKGEDTVVLVGSGSTVPQPLYKVWEEQYNKRNPRVQVRYMPFGTSEGINLISNGKGDFGAGEVRLSAKQTHDGGLMAVPTVLIGIVPIYKLLGEHRELQLSGELLADIYLGEIKNWNDPRIARLNPGISLPNLPIQVVYRPGGKGSNYVFTDYLSKVSPKFHARIGVSASPKWPVGVAAERSLDMADKVKATAGAIGYVELSYAVKQGIAYGLVQNSSGQAIKATRETLRAACAAHASRSEDLSMSLTAAPGRDSYPITSFTWLYLRSKNTDSKHAAALHDLITWMLSDGQQLAVKEGYAELPPEVLVRARRKIDSIR